MDDPERSSLRWRLVGLAVLTLMLSAGCEARVELQQAAAAPSARQDGYTKVADTPLGEGVMKRCDGPHLLYVFDAYRRGGIAVVPNGCAR